MAKRGDSRRIGGRALAGLVLALALAACAGAPSGMPKEEVTLDAETFSFGKLEFGEFDTYLIAPGDTLDVLYQLQTWKDMGPYHIAKDDTVAVKFPNLPDLNEEQPVRPDGTISLPYLGQVKAEDKTVDELAAELKEMYADVLKHPDLYVTVPVFQSQLREFKQDLRTAPRGLSRLVTVRLDGVATFPMIGHLKVSGRTVEAVNKDLNEFYRDTVSPSLRVDLFLQEHSGSLVYVMGEVGEAGAYKISRPISVLEAITLAKGFTHQAELSSVVVARRREDKVIARSIDLNGPLGGDGSSSLFYLRPDDIVFVPRSRISTIAQVMRNLSEIILFRGWNLGFSWELHKEPSRTQDN